MERLKHLIINMIDFIKYSSGRHNNRTGTQSFSVSPLPVANCGFA
jgi:hypothetical protein